MTKDQARVDERREAFEMQHANVMGIGFLQHDDEGYTCFETAHKFAWFKYGWDSHNTPMQDAWQPIETAPRDWSDIIGYTPNNGCVSEMYFSCEDGGKNHWMNHYRNKVSPTHWMPLPAAPQINKIIGE